MSSNYRSTICWSCANPLESVKNEECPVCGWMICPVCGACEQYGCFSLVAKTKIARIAYRDLYTRQYCSVDVRSRPPVQIWKDQQSPEVLLEAENKTIQSLNEKEEAQRRAIIEANRQKRQAEKQEQKKESQRRESLIEQLQQYGVRSPTRGNGVFIRLYNDGKFPMIECSFDGEKKAYQFPDAFDKGFLSVNK